MLLGVQGCSLFTRDEQGNLVVQGAEGYCARIEGHGPPFTGGGQITRCKVGKDFKGRAFIGPDGSIMIEKE